MSSVLKKSQASGGAPIREIDPAEALARQREAALLLDVREDDERATSGVPAAAIALSLAEIPARIAEIAADLTREMLTICGSGRRSLLAAHTLREMGYTKVASVRGGFLRWQTEGLPIEPGQIDAALAGRYARQLVLPEVGVDGQKKLRDARIALVGAGGLGSPAALYLVAAGVGTLSLIDDDRVERSNLQRQILHTDARTGMRKTESAEIALSALNPDVRLNLCEERLRAANVEALVRDHDVIIDGADNFPTRYLLNAACLRLKIPLVYGAVHRFTGQVSVFDSRRSDSPCYRCLFPEPPSAAEAPNCSEAGVLGVLPGVIGLLQATEALKLVLGIGETLAGRLLCFDALAAEFRELGLSRDPTCPGCGADAIFKGYDDLEDLCASGQ